MEPWHKRKAHWSWTWRQMNKLNKKDKYRTFFFKKQEKYSMCFTCAFINYQAGEGFILRNYLTSNIKNDIRRTKNDFSIPIQGINMETISLFLSNSSPEQIEIVFMDLHRTCDWIRVCACFIRKSSRSDVSARLALWNFSLAALGKTYMQANTLIWLRTWVITMRNKIIHFKFWISWLFHRTNNCFGEICLYCLFMFAHHQGLKS